MHARLPCAVLAARAVPASRIRARLRTTPRWMSAFPPRPVPQRRLQIEEGTYGRRRRSKSWQSRRSAWTTSERASLSRPSGRLKSSRSCTTRTPSISKRSSPRQMKIAWFIASIKREMLSGGIHIQDCFEQLNILELFLDCIRETNERLIEFGIGGICNSCVDPANALVIVQCGGIPLVIYNTYQQRCGALSISEANKRRFCSLGRVTYTLGYHLCNPATKKEILKPDVVRIIREYAAAGAVNTSFSNMANAFLGKHVDP